MCSGSRSGAALDNCNIPAPGVTLSIEGTAFSPVSDAQDQFTIPSARPPKPGSPRARRGN